MKHDGHLHQSLNLQDEKFLLCGNYCQEITKHQLLDVEIHLSVPWGYSTKTELTHPTSMAFYFNTGAKYRLVDLSKYL